MRLCLPSTSCYSFSPSLMWIIDRCAYFFLTSIVSRNIRLTSMIVTICFFVIVAIDYSYIVLLSLSSPSMLFKTSSPCLLRFPVGKKEVPPKAASHIFPALLSLKEPCFRTVRRSERQKEAEEIKIRPCRIFRTGILWRPVSIQKKTTSHLDTAIMYQGLTANLFAVR